MANTVNALREVGNNYFSARNYSEAINYYTKAIVSDPSVVTLYTNRALCYLKLKQWELVCHDCNRSIEINPKHFKAFYLKGQALIELNALDDAINSLHHAQELAKEQRAYVDDSIPKVLRIARKKKFMIQDEERRRQEIDLQVELKALLVDDKLKQIQLAKSQHNGQTDMIVDNIEDAYADRMMQLNHLFEQVDDRRKKREVPDVFCSRINFGIMRDPVITPSGITYERKDIEEHLKVLGNFDPVTRKELTVDQLIPNLALKEVIDTFLEENPWAEDY